MGLKFLFVFLGSELGGAERQGLYLARYLHEHFGGRVRVWGVMADKPGRVAELCDEMEIPWSAVPFDWPQKRLKRALELLRFARRLSGERPDIVLPYTWLPNIVCGLVWRLSGAKLCVWNQRDEGLCLNESLWHKTAVRLTPCFVANSNVGGDFLSKKYSIPASRFEVIHNGVALPMAQADRADFREIHGIHASSLVATMVGNLHPYKDHLTLLRAWRLVIDRFPGQGAPPVLLLAGRFDEMEHRLKALAFELRLGDHVRFLGKMKDVSGLLQASDLYVHSSKTEGLPNGILEGMASGLPVIATDIPGHRETLGEGAGDPYVSAGDAEGLAVKILAFFDDPQKRTTAGDWNRKRAQTEFSYGRMCARYEKFLQSHC